MIRAENLDWLLLQEELAVGAIRRLDLEALAIRVDRWREDGHGSAGRPKEEKSARATYVDGNPASERG